MSLSQRQLADHALGLPQPSALLGAHAVVCRRTSLESLLAAREELVAPGRQPVRLDPQLAGSSSRRSPRSSRSTASVFLFADQRVSRP